MAWHVSLRSLEKPGSMPGFLTRARGWPVSSPSVLEDALRRDRAVVALVLMTVITASWLYLLTGAGTGVYPHEIASLVPGQTSMEPAIPGAAGMSGDETMAAAGGDSSMMGMVMSPATWTPGYALRMFSMWWLMMIAMMLSGAAPMVLLHAAVTRKGLARADDGRPNAPSHRLLSATTVFIAGYLVTWGAFSLVAVVAQWALERGELLSPMMMSTNRFLGSGLLLGAGLWQLTPLKTVCLRQCRSPISFLSSHWRPGVGGAFRMGTRHGVFCLGCCWFLMALLFYAGVMNLTWIIGLALLVLAEKTVPAGVAFGRVTGLLLIASGAWLGFTAF
jgi:predicted metal-binding membrane protein